MNYLSNYNKWSLQLGKDQKKKKTDEAIFQIF